MKRDIFKKTGKILFIILAVAAGLSAAGFVFAQELDTGLEYGAGTGLGDTDPRIIAARVIRYFLGFLGIIAVGLIMYAGWLWMTSEGNEEKIAQAKKVLTNALVGLAIIMGSFAIVSFILNRLAGAGGGGPGAGGGGPGAGGGGIGVIGACSVESVYPEPDQTEVPRNTGIIVTFKEAVNPATICQDNSGDGVYCNCSAGICDQIAQENVRIFKTNQGDSCQYENGEWLNCENLNITAVRALSNNNETFVFSPVNYLGSPSEYVWYSVYLSNDIQRQADGQGIFKNCRTDYLEWKFQVSNKIDLTPPQVEAGGVFPVPDNAGDVAGLVEEAVSAQGKIAVNSQPDVYQLATVGMPAPAGDSGEATTNNIYNCQADGTISITISPELTVNASGVTGVVSGDDASDGIAAVGCGLTLSPADGNFSAGNQWTVAVTAGKQADTLTVGSITYTFVAAAPSGNQIQRGNDVNGTANNIVSVLGGHPDVNASALGKLVTLTAKVAGSAGNNIVLTSSNPAALAITAMAGGKDKETTTTIKDKEDKPKNAVIQINFNEAVNPLLVAGQAGEVANYIRVVNASPGAAPAGGACGADADCTSFECNGGVCAAGAYLDGRFVVSNQYETVEFIPDNNCGINSCGESVYCLPENSHLRVEIMAASLADCGSDNCVSRSPYNNCVGNVCQDGTGKKYPQADITALDGIVDMAANSLDGNRNQAAQGPVSFYNENIPEGSGGDNYQWSFFISDKTDLTPPLISGISPAHNAVGVDLSASVKINFNKLMLSSSLQTGSDEIFNGQESTEHKLINVWDFTGQGVGYWVAKLNVDAEPLDGEADWTEAEIRHSLFADTSGYRVQVGSGVKDIYQNCFRPSSSTTCQGNPSCCGEIPTSDSQCP